MAKLYPIDVMVLRDDEGKSLMSKGHHEDASCPQCQALYLHPPAAEVQRLREALEYLIEKCGDSDDAQYSTLGTKFVRDIARRALEGE